MTKLNSSSTTTKKSPLIRASELAHFGFCERAWWLAIVKKVPAANQTDRQRGTRHHQAHARQVRAAHRRRQMGLILLVGGTLLLLLGLGLWVW